MNLYVKFPEPALVPGKARASLRRAMNNAIRGPMRQANAELHRTGRYEKLRPGWRFTQETVADGASYSLINDIRASRYLLARKGIKKHDIEMPAHVAPLRNLIAWAMRLNLPVSYAFIALRKIALEGQTMHHPGTKPDVQALAVLDRTERTVLERVPRYLDAWASTWGQSSSGGGE